MNKITISADNVLQNILDFDICKKLIAQAEINNESMVILCPHYSINIASKYEDGEQLEWDMDELSDYVGYFIEVSDYDDMVVYFNTDDEYTPPIEVKDIIVGAKFKTEDDTIWTIDSLEDSDYGILVRTSMERGQKGRYRDGLHECIAFLNQENSVKI